MFTRTGFNTGLPSEKGRGIFTGETLRMIEDINMKPENLRSIKKLLLRRLNELQFEAIQAAFDKRVMNDNPADFVDKASREFEQNAEMMMEERKSSLRQELQEAIMRIDRGVFGICEVCEGRISERRLLAIPTSRSCMACMEKEGNPKAA
jgi:DnaK suppressor protein